MSTICEGIPSNPDRPDISGIGIRIDFYVTIFITVVIPRRRSTEKLIDALNANAGITGFGLLIAAIIQTFQNRLGPVPRHLRATHRVFSWSNSVFFWCIQMDAHAHTTWGRLSDNDSRSVSWPGQYMSGQTQ
ncbi:hypothetical protein EDB85DRAFT_662304 [Lactarius pseudohatsudake]|nr:hypothetical protein EDB85DRAFT_662304 [Lactarius pseudohatsudake]